MSTKRIGRSKDLACCRRCKAKEGICWQYYRSEYETETPPHL